MLLFEQAVKVLNQEWDAIMTEVVDFKGNHYERWEIINTISHHPTLADCFAIASYFDMKYVKGYFYKKLPLRQK